MKILHFRRNFNQNFVPKYQPVDKSDIELLRKFIKDFNKIFILTGAGISTESGIPDYRSEDVGLYARTNHKPIQYQEFLKSSHARKRYWARNYVGWSSFSSRLPNINHEIIKDLEVIKKKVSVVVTQNVDNLHKKAGSENVIELHGSAFKVVCLNCNEIFRREDVQIDLERNNKHISTLVSTFLRPDGDVEIPQKDIDNFNPPICGKCKDGVLKPDIVFFGHNVPKERVNKVKDYVKNSDAILVLGSTLTVFSAYRIILQAVEENKPIAAINIGPTRADKHLSLKISTKCGDILPQII